MFINRRQVLLGTAATSLAGCATANVPRRDADVLVLGAGLSGLRAARKLQADGYKVLVLEGSNRIGGRLHTLDDLPGRPEAGGIEIGQSYKRLREEAAETGIKIVPATRSKATGRTMILDGKVFDSDDWAKQPGNALPEAFRAAHPDRVLFRAAMGDNPFPTSESWRTPSAETDISAADFLRRAGFDVDALSLADRALNANSLETYSMVNVWRTLTLFLSAGPPAPSERIEGGSQRLPEAMAASLEPNTVRLGQRIRSITETGTTVRVVTDQATFVASAIVCTLPFPALNRIATDAALCATTRTAIRGLPYTQVQQIHLEIEKLPTDGLPLSMWTDTPIERVFTTDDAQGQPIGLKVWINGDGTRPDASDAEWFALAKSVLEGQRGMKVRPQKVVRWDQRQPFSGGAYMHWAPGQVSAWAETMGASTPRIAFAGEHLSYHHTGMEGALESADAAIERVRTMLAG